MTAVASPPLAVVEAPPRNSLGGWVSEHLFATRLDGAITLFTVIVFGGAALLTARWALFEAKWTVIGVNLRILLVGRFPQGEEWRIWIPTLLVAALIGTTWGLVRRPGRRGLVAAALVSAILLLLARSATLVPILGIVALLGAGLVLGAAARTRPALRRVVGWAAIVGWCAAWPLAIALLLGFGGVEVERWGGLYLNIIITAAGAMGALPLGILIALGRRSSYRVIHMCCAAYVEVIRGIPLMVVLVLSWLAIQRFLPPIWGIDQVGLLPRILAAYILFTAVYVAVCVNGGLNGIPRGQQEAAAALGLTSYQTTTRILLPQAMRRAIPSLIGELIDLLMASTLVSVLGLTDMVAAARATTEQPDFFGRQKEVLLFVGLLFWLMAFSLSRLGRAMERALTPRESGGTVQR